MLSVGKYTFIGWWVGGGWVDGGWVGGWRVAGSTENKANSAMA